MERITADNLAELLAIEPHGIRRDLALDLREARARIEYLERLSASQEEALQAMERGAL